MVPTLGLPGFDTYQITATSNLGSVVGVDFVGDGSRGIFGPLNQIQPYGQTTIFPSPVLTSDNLAEDSQFLVKSNDVLSILTSESGDHLQGAFSFLGDKQLSAGQSLSFAQLTTADPTAVTLNGTIVTRDALGNYQQETVNSRLSDILMGAAPQIALLPPILPSPTESAPAVKVTEDLTPVPPLVTSPPPIVESPVDRPKTTPPAGSGTEITVIATPPQESGPGELVPVDSGLVNAIDLDDGSQRWAEFKLMISDGQISVDSVRYMFSSVAKEDLIAGALLPHLEYMPVENMAPSFGKVAMFGGAVEVNADAASAAPEPSTILLLIVGAFVASIRRDFTALRTQID
jgi:hypothetical protein